jgi:hypothetical protein
LPTVIPEEETLMSEPITIKIEGPTRAFHQGVAAGTDVADSMADIPAAVGYMERMQFFWLSVGTKLATTGIDGDDDQMVAAFVAGAKQSAPDMGN